MYENPPYFTNLEIGKICTVHSPLKRGGKNSHQHANETKDKCERAVLNFESVVHKKKKINLSINQCNRIACLEFQAV
jgi:hypothetical protein